MTITMFDSTDGPSVMLSGDYAYAGYVNGNWPNYTHIVSAFPGKNVLSIAVTANANAMCLDIENGDATNDQAASWLLRQFVRGVQRPVLYTSVSNADTLARIVAGYGINRSAHRLWTAHYDAGQHICGPSTCKRTNQYVDGTQWTDRAFNRNLDASILRDDFFGVKVQPDFSPPVVTEPIVSALAASQGAWLLAASGAIYAFAGAPYLGGANNKPYFVGRTAAKLLTPNADQAAAGKKYIIEDSAGETYAYPE